VEISKSEFDSMVDDYVVAKKREQEAGKVTKVLGPQIKKYLAEDNLTNYDTADSSVSVQIRSSVSFDEELLIDYLKSSGLSRGLVKRKEYVDFDALESAIYRGKLSEEQIKELDKFKIEKTTSALVIKK
jgi:hypothetical protein